MTNKMSIEIITRRGKQLVSARELFEKFDVKERFSKWWNRTISYGFEEKVDYMVCTKKYAANQYSGKKDFVDYLITIDTAKEICMIQRSEIGRKFRQYFIECEKLYRERQSVEYQKIRAKSKVVRNDFTDTLKLHGCDKFYHYSNITRDMKRTFGITAKKENMSISELTKITASEYLAEAMLCNEQGYSEVSPVCVDASIAIANALINRKQKILA